MFFNLSAEPKAKIFTSCIKNIKIYVIHNFVSEECCDQLFNFVQENTNKQLFVVPGLYKSQLIESLSDKICTFTGLKKINSQPLEAEIFHVNQGRAERLQGDSNGHYCMKICLTDHCGGNLYFSKLDLQINLQKGMALFFPVDNPKSSYSDLVVNSGCKVLLTKYFSKHEVYIEPFLLPAQKPNTIDDYNLIGFSVKQGAVFPNVLDNIDHSDQERNATEKFICLLATHDKKTIEETARIIMNSWTQKETKILYTSGVHYGAGHTFKNGLYLLLNTGQDTINVSTTDNYGNKCEIPIPHKHYALLTSGYKIENYATFAVVSFTLVS